MKFKRWGRSFWQKKNMQQTSGGSWGWVLSVTWNRICPKVGRKSRPQPRRCTQTLTNTDFCKILLNNSSTDDIWSCIVLQWHGYIIKRGKLVTIRAALLSQHTNLSTNACPVIPDFSQPLPLWRTSATPVCESLQSWFNLTQKRIHSLKQLDLFSIYSCARFAKEGSLLRTNWWDFPGQIGLAPRL